MKFTCAGVIIVIDRLVLFVPFILILDIEALNDGPMH
jgi:hypothetical protein